MSRRRDDRPELARIMEAAARGDMDVLVVPKLDRLKPLYSTSARVIEDLEAAGVRLVSIGDSIDTSSAAGQLLLGVLAVVAQFESTRLGERVASVTAARAARGGITVGRPTATAASKDNS